MRSVSIHFSGTTSSYVLILIATSNQPTTVCLYTFQIDNTTFYHHMAVGVQIQYVIGGHGDPVVLLRGFAFLESHL